MAAIVVTMDELQVFKQELLEEFRNMIKGLPDRPKQLLRNADVRKLLGISATTLQTLRINGTLPYSKIGGTLYYDYNEVMRVFESNKKG